MIFDAPALDVPALDRSTINKIRKAESLGFRLENGESSLCYRHKGETLRHGCDSKIWSGKYHGGVSLPTEKLHGWVFEPIKQCDVLATFAEFLKEGDRIQCCWFENNNNGYLVESVYQPKDRMPGYTNLYRDELRVVVARNRIPHVGAVTTTKLHTFLIAVSICADNPQYPSNSARICRRSLS